MQENAFLIVFLYKEWIFPFIGFLYTYAMSHKITILVVVAGFLNLILPGVLSARDAPFTTAGSSNVCPGGAVIVPVSVANFTSIGAITLRLDYNPTQLIFGSFTNLNPSFAGAALNNVNVSDTLAKIMIVWASLNALTIPDSTKLLDINFTLLTGSPEINYNNTANGGGDCEYADENGMALNDLPSEMFYFNSTITNSGVAAADSVSGALSLCAGTSDVPYSVLPVENATGYIWTIPPGGSIVSGENSPSIVVNYSTMAVSGNISVAGTNTCGTGQSASLPVTIFPLPVPVIIGMDSVCVLSTGNIYSTDSAMTNYSWTISSGGIITSGEGTKSITADWNTSGPQYISVSYTDSSGCAATSPTGLNIMVKTFPDAAGVITGNSNVCSGDNEIPYSVPPIADASSYTWILPAGAVIASGSGTYNIMVNFSSSAESGNIMVIGNNSCGNGSPSPDFPVIVTQIPVAAGSITGPGIVCTVANNVIFSVPAIANAAIYDWNIPPGAVITAGATTNQIVMSFGTEPGTGVITVKGTNFCGSGPISPDFFITMIDSQTAPVATAEGPLLTSSIPTGNQWYYEGTGLIPDATGQTYLATTTGWYWTVVMGEGCPILESNHVYVLFAGQEELNNNNCSVYPVPGDGKFNISITSPSKRRYTIQVYNQTGMKLFERHDIIVMGTIEQQIDIRPVACGIYSVVFLDGNSAVVRKMLVR